jgi:uncharacterized protein GlcG (DUF336 family)
LSSAQSSIRAEDSVTSKIPLKDVDGQIIGAIGVSGSSVENDHMCAQAGVDALSEQQIAVGI